MSPWCLLRGALEAHKTWFPPDIKHNVSESSSDWTLQEDEPEILSSSKARGKVGHWTENQENAPQGGDQMTPEEEIPVENRNQVSTLVRASVQNLETSNLGSVKAATKSLWIGLNKDVVFYGSNCMVQIPNEMWFI